MPGNRLIDGALVDYLAVVDRAMAVVTRERILWANTALSKMVGTSISELEGMPLFVLTESEVATSALRISTLPCNVKHSTGLVIPADVRAVPLDGSTWMIEISHRQDRKTEEAVELYKERLWSLADQVPVGVFFSEVGIRLQFINDKMAEIFEASVDRLVGIGWLDFIDADHRSSVEDSAFRALHGGRDEVAINLTLGAGRSKSVVMSFGSVHAKDGSAGFVGTIVEFASQLDSSASTPPSREREAISGFVEELKAAMQQRSNVAPVAVVFCDLPRVSEISEILGAQASDRIVRAVGEVLGAACGPEDVVSLIGVGEFLVVLKDKGSQRDVMEVLHKVEEAFAGPIPLEGCVMKVKVDVGYALVGPDGVAALLGVDGDASMLEVVKQMKSNLKRDLEDGTVESVDRGEQG